MHWVYCAAKLRLAKGKDKPAIDFFGDDRGSHPIDLKRYVINQLKGGVIRHRYITDKLIKKQKSRSTVY